MYVDYFRSIGKKNFWLLLLLLFHRSLFCPYDCGRSSVSSYSFAFLYSHTCTYGLAVAMLPLTHTMQALLGCSCQMSLGLRMSAYLHLCARFRTNLWERSNILTVETARKSNCFDIPMSFFFFFDQSYEPSGCIQKIYPIVAVCCYFCTFVIVIARVYVDAIAV